MQNHELIALLSEHPSGTEVVVRASSKFEDWELTGPVQKVFVEKDKIVIEGWNEEEEYFPPGDK
jgi:hypothetical protein